MSPAESIPVPDPVESAFGSRFCEASGGRTEQDTQMAHVTRIEGRIQSENGIAVLTAAF